MTGDSDKEKPKAPRKPRKGSIAALVAEELAAWEAERAARPPADPKAPSWISTLPRSGGEPWDTDN
jgi:hypothetical protein